MTRIGLQGVTKSFRGTRILHELALEVESGRLVALLGPSGSSKTMLLRSIAGLEEIDAGRILFGERDVTAEPANRRGVGFVFQHYALFEHMSVRDNVAFGLTARPRAQRQPPERIEARVRELLELVQLPELAGRRPSELSGGQKQRIALARALAVHPEVLLLDEPFGALDARVRRDLRAWLRELHDRVPCTSLFVTHDQEEALEIADTIVVLRAGRIEQVGSPDELYRAPASVFVHQFLGESNLFELEPGGGEPRIARLASAAPGEDAPEGWTGCARPHETGLAEAAPAGAGVHGIVRRVQTTGAVARIELDAGGARPVLVDLAHAELAARRIAPGDGLWAVPRALRVYAPPGRGIAPRTHAPASAPARASRLARG